MVFIVLIEQHLLGRVVAKGAVRARRLPAADHSVKREVTQPSFFRVCCRSRSK
jgi:hypothetical protein